MAIKKKSEELTQEEVKLNIKVTRAKEVNGQYAFDMVVNGVSIYGCWYREVERKDGSGSFNVVSFPSHKSEKDGKYYNYVYFKISDDDMKNIENQISEML